MLERHTSWKQEIAVSINELLGEMIFAAELLLNELQIQGCLLALTRPLLDHELILPYFLFNADDHFNNFKKTLYAS